MSANERTRRILILIRENCEDTIAFADRAASFEAFCENKLVRKAIVMSIINIGELTKKLPDEFKATHKDVQWRKIAGMRDLAAHGYHTMDNSIIWSVARESIPELLEFISALI